MRRAVIIVMIGCLLGIGTNVFADYDDLILKIDRAWNNRSADVSEMKNALSWSEQAYGEKPGFEAAYRAARACFWICDRSSDKAVDKEYGKRGSEWAEKAIEYKPEAVEGHYYYTVCVGEYGKGIGILRALGKGIGGKYERHCKKAIAINAGYDHGSPLRALGRYFYKLPRGVYSFKKSEKYLLQSLKKAPKHARTLAYLADLYIKEKTYDTAKEMLKKLDALDSGYSDAQFDHKYYKSYGKDLTESIKDK